VKLAFTVSAVLVFTALLAGCAARKRQPPLPPAAPPSGNQVMAQQFTIQVLEIPPTRTAPVLSGQYCTTFSSRSQVSDGRVQEGNRECPLSAKPGNGGTK
jgi:nitrous oxide reductase accessory protein NosL